MQKVTIGIGETKEFLSWVYSLIKAGVEVTEDQKYNLKDVPSIFPVISKSIKAFGGIEKVLAEMLDLTEDEENELILQAQQELDLTSEKYKPFILNAMKWGLDYFALHAEFLEIRKAA